VDLLQQKWPFLLVGVQRRDPLRQWRGEESGRGDIIRQWRGEKPGGGALSGGEQRNKAGASVAGKGSACGGREQAVPV